MAVRKDFEGLGGELFDIEKRTLEDRKADIYTDVEKIANIVGGSFGRMSDIIYDEDASDVEFVLRNIERERGSFYPPVYMAIAVKDGAKELSIHGYKPSEEKMEKLKGLGYKVVIDRSD